MSKSTQITLRSNLPESARQELSEAGLHDFNVGDIFIEHRDGNLRRINRIDVDKTTGKITYIGYGCDNDLDGETFSDSYGGENTISEFINNMERYDWEKIPDGNIKKWRDAALAIINGEAKIEDYADKSSDSLNSETAILDTGSKSALLLMQQEMEGKRKNAELVARFVKREMEKRKAELEKIREGMNQLVASFKEKIKKIMRVILNIELYLGINEELFKIQSGTLADVNTPITFRQAVLYMDEEIGHYENGGVDYNDISWFDEWVVKDDNFKKLLPEEKGMVVLRPRRRAKDYGEDAYTNTRKNENNLNSTYLLIRNGENFYRIFSDNIVILPRLFPLKNELQKMFDEMLEKQKEEAHVSSYEKEKTKEKFEDSMYEYKQRAALMQGLIDRSEVFHPLPCKINIFNLEETKHLVNFVYDDEALLPSGRTSFVEWQKKLNSTITHGSRIMITGNYGKELTWGKYSEEEKRDRIFYHFNSAPKLPAAGIYDVVLYKEPVVEWIREDKVDEIRKCTNFKILDERQGDHIKSYFPPANSQEKMFPRVESFFQEMKCAYDKEHLTIMYNPKDTVYGSWGEYNPKERKKSIRWKIFPDDEFILHWDRLSADDVDFYLQSRVDRPNYLSMMPVLVKVKKLLAEEAAKEAPFIQLLTGSLMLKLPKLNMEQVQERVIRCVAWWKEKNMIKRAIDKDDVLAIRMIEKRVTSKNYDKLKWEE